MSNFLFQPLVKGRALHRCAGQHHPDRWQCPSGHHILVLWDCSRSHGKKGVMIMIISLLTILSNILLSIWYISEGGLFFAFLLSFVGNAAQLIFIVHVTVPPI